MATERKTYTYTPFSYADYAESQDVLDAKDKKTGAENALANYGDFTYSNQGLLDDVMNRINNREKFSYDLNGDALYQQYKDKYIQQGKMAMADTMGQAAAMTGGYGNSYAASVGNQAYQASLQQLNDIIPELYQMAYDRYNQEGQDLYNLYGLHSNERSTEYGMWGDKRNALIADRDYYGTEYNNAFNRDYGMYSDDRTLAHSEHTNKENYKYQDIADANAYEQWKASYDEGVRQFNETMDFNKAQANKAVTSSAPTLTAEEYNEVLLNAADYATKGKASLKNYLNGLVSRGLSADEAADIYEQYFPTIIPETSPSKSLSPDNRNYYHTKN